MNWIVLAIISVLVMSVANLYQRIIMRESDSDPLASSIFFQFSITVVIGIYAVFHGFIMPPLVEFPQYFIFSGVFYAMGTLALFSAAKKIEASELVIYSATGVLVTIVAAILFLHEPFSVKQIFGTILIISSVLLVQNKLSITKNKGVLYAILGTSFYALALVSDTFILRRYDSVSYAVVISFLPGLFLLIAQPRVIYRFKNLIQRNYVQNMSIYSGLYGIQAILYYGAISVGANASQMAPISRSQIILTVLLAAIFLKERDRLFVKVISAILTIVGILFIK